MSLGGSSGNNNSVTQLDPTLKQAWMDTYGLAKQTAGEAVPQQGVAGFTPVGIAAQQMTGAAAGQGKAAIDDAIARTQQVGSQGPAYAGIDHYSTHQASAPDPSTYGFRDVSAPTVSAAQIGATPGAAASLIGRGDVRDVSAPTFSGDALTKYFNPYDTGVIKTSLSDLDRARRIANNGVSSSMTGQGGEGAWNGARAGVEAGQNDDAYYRQAGQLSAQLRQQGFDTASGLYGQDAARSMAAGQANQGADLSVSSQNAQTGTNTSQFNAGQALQRALEQAGLVQQSSTANQGAALTAAQANQQADIGKSGTIYGAGLTTGLSNAAAETQKERDNANANTTGMQFNAQQDQAQRALQLNAAQAEAGMAPTQQGIALTGAQAVTGVGDAQRQLQQQGLDTQFNNQMLARNLGLQTVESAFGIIPTTASGGSSISHSSGKSGTI